MKESHWRHVASLFALAVFGLLAFGSVDTDSDTREIQSRPASYTISADQLYNEYETNEVAADAKYKGKVVIVTGTIQNIGKDILDNAYIIIGGSGHLDGVQCSFTKGEESSVASLRKGQRVTVKGEVRGKIVAVQVEKARIQ